MHEEPEAVEDEVYVICVVALDREVLPKRVYNNCYMSVKGSREEAVKLQDRISRVGFKINGNRIFPDDIESINLKKKDDVDGEKEDA